MSSLARFEGLIAALADPAAPTAVHDRADVLNVHVADSLAGLEIEALREARRIGDLGSGAGLPGSRPLVSLPAHPRARGGMGAHATNRCYRRPASLA